MEDNTWEAFKNWMLERVCCYCSKKCNLDGHDPITLSCWAWWYTEWVEELHEK